MKGEDTRSKEWRGEDVRIREDKKEKDEKHGNDKFLL